nr:hypothetical protein CFP56_25811 [Quercus suber]
MMNLERCPLVGRPDVRCERRALSTARPMSDYNGLRLTRGERIVVVALSYLFCAPVVYRNTKALLRYLYILSAATRRRRVRAAQERERDAAGREREAVQ